MSYQDFIGRREVQGDVAELGRFQGLSALLDREHPDPTGTMVPPLGHFLCFPPLCRQSALGHDGHPLRTSDSLLPPVDLPRRMWAGSDIRFLHDIPIGAAITRHSTVVAVKPKDGRSGQMLFVTVRHEIAIDDGPVAIIEDQDIVYRSAATAPAPQAATAIAQIPEITSGWVRRVVPDPIMLFRFSALTFNSHRIHYDRPYSMLEEGYPGLVVQGPLIATLLMHSLLREEPKRRISTFRFRGVGPSYDGRELALCVEPDNAGAALRAYGPAGLVTDAYAEFRK